MADGDLPVTWRKSSHSKDGDCLEWLIDVDHVRLRESTGSAGELRLSYSQWQAFLAAVKDGEADLPAGRHPS